MPGPYHTPGVYIEEISKFPPSIAQVETAIPAFIGYTEKAEKNGESLYPDASNSIPTTPTRISSLLDYEQYFGKGHEPIKLNVHLTSDNKVEKVETDPGFNLYYSLQLFYSNGGGDCYIVPIGVIMLLSIL